MEANFSIAGYVICEYLLFPLFLIFTGATYRCDYSGIALPAAGHEIFHQAHLDKLNT